MGCAASRFSSILSRVLDVLEKSSVVLNEVADLAAAVLRAWRRAASSVVGAAGVRKCHARGRRKLRIPSRPSVDPKPECFTPK